MTKKEKYQQHKRYYTVVKDKGMDAVTKKDLKPPKEKIRPRYPSEQGEREVLKETKYLLERCGMFPIRRNSGDFLTLNGRYIRIGENGEADLEVLADKGRVVFVELKAGDGGDLSENQIKFRNKITDMGHVYLTACSAREAKEKVFEALNMKDDWFEREDNELTKENGS
jgi:hypothetical protein